MLLMLTVLLQHYYLILLLVITRKILCSHQTSIKIIMSKVRSGLTLNAATVTADANASQIQTGRLRTGDKQTPDYRQL